MSLANIIRFERFFDRGAATYLLVLGLGAAVATAVLGV